MVYWVCPSFFHLSKMLSLPAPGRSIYLSLYIIFPLLLDIRCTYLVCKILFNCYHAAIFLSWLGGVFIFTTASLCHMQQTTCTSPSSDVSCTRAYPKSSRAYPPPRMTMHELADDGFKRSQLTVSLRVANHSFTVPVKIGNQKFKLLLDTDSSDT